LTPLGYVASHSDIAVVAFLLKKCANADDRDEENQTILHRVSIAVKESERNFESLKIMSLLLHHGAEPNCTDTALRMPLQLSVNAGSIHAVELLISYGANVNARNDLGRAALY